jgi:hypothetical protein
LSIEADALIALGGLLAPTIRKCTEDMRRSI